jgi:hypothetical protein
MNSRGARTGGRKEAGPTAEAGALSCKRGRRRRGGEAEEENDRDADDLIVGLHLEEGLQQARNLREDVQQAKNQLEAKREFQKAIDQTQQK